MRNTVFEILSSLLKYIFITIIYIFIYRIIRLIYLDIQSMNRKTIPIPKGSPYLRLLNFKENLNFKVEESYAVGDNVTIGRLSKNRIAIQDPYLSGQHARVAKRDEQYYLEDLGSKNGTFLNGRQVENQAVPISDGDRIMVGQLNFLFVCDRK